jgi:hypothetical protein
MQLAGTAAAVYDAADLGLNVLGYNNVARGCTSYWDMSARLCKCSTCRKVADVRLGRAESPTDRPQDTVPAKINCKWSGSRHHVDRIGEAGYPHHLPIKKSCTHQKRPWPTRRDHVQSKPANRPVPCKHKGMRGFSKKFGNDQEWGVNPRSGRRFESCRPDRMAGETLSSQSVLSLRDENPG